MSDDIRISICAPRIPWIAHGVAALVEAACRCRCDPSVVSDGGRRLPEGVDPDLLIWCAPSTHCPPPHPVSRRGRSRTLFLSTGWTESETAARMAGLSGYLGPDCRPGDLHDAVRIVAAGGFYYRPGCGCGAPIGPLTPKQRILLAGVGAGLSDGEIAARMKITERTVRYHLEELLNRLGVDRRGEAIALAALGGMCEER